MIVQGGIGNGESKIERNDDRSGVLLLHTADYIGKKLNHERGITYRHFITSHRKVIAQQDKRSEAASVIIIIIIWGAQVEGRQRRWAGGATAANRQFLPSG